MLAVIRNAKVFMCMVEDGEGVPKMLSIASASPHFPLDAALPAISPSIYPLSILIWAERLSRKGLLLLCPEGRINISLLWSTSANGDTPGRQIGKFWNLRDSWDPRSPT